MRVSIPSIPRPVRRQARCVWILPLCALLLPAPSQADPARGRDYIKTLRQYRIPLSSSETASIITGETGEAYEVRGTVNGIATQAGGYTLLLKTDTGSSLFVSGTGEAPDISIGTGIRVVLKDGTGETGTQMAQVVAVATEGEVEAATPRPAPKPAKAAATKTKKATPLRKTRAALASRGIAYRRAPATGALTSSEVFNAYRRAIQYFNPRLSAQQLNTITSAILNYSIRYGVDARLVMAVVAVESNFKTSATSRAGAMGLGQLMPGTARGLGVTNAYDPEQNLEGAIRLIRGHLDSHSDKDVVKQLALALASYNAGPGAVRKYGGVPPYRETRNYVAKVIGWYRHFLGEG